MHIRALLAVIVLWGIARAEVKWSSDGWTALGEHEVKGKAGQGRIDPSRYESDMSKLTIVVDNGDLELTGVEVIFDNGKKHAPRIRHAFIDGARTLPIALPVFRAIKSLRFKYKNARGKPVVQAFGWDQPPWDNAGWTELGDQELSSKKPTRITTRSKTKFAKVTIVVDFGEVEIKQLTVQFADNKTFTAKVGHTFKGNERVRTVELPSPASAITSVEIENGDPGVGAYVQVWAK